MAAAGTVGAISAAVVALVAAGCGGPLDSPDPLPRRDAGAGGTGAGGYRVVDAAPEVRRDAPIDMAPDLVRDARVLPDATDATLDGGDGGADADAGWPVVPGCVTGLPPTIVVTPVMIPTVVVSCAPSTTLLTRLLDPTRQGFVYDATLDPPINGFSLSFGSVCSYAVDSEINLFVGPSAVLPGTNFKARLNITVHGPPPAPTYVLPFAISAVALDFAVAPADIDFGVVPQGGQLLTLPVMITNAADSAPLSNVYPSQTSPGPFQLFVNNAVATPLQPGDTQPLLTASLVPMVPGTYNASFVVSGVSPGSGANSACSVVRTVTMRAQVIQTLPP